MNFSRNLLAAASILATISACSEGEPDNQMAAPSNEAISADNGLGMANEASDGGEAEVQAPAPVAVATNSEPASKVEPGEAAPISAATRAEVPRPDPKAAPKAPAKAQPKASEAESKIAPAAPAATSACAPEHRAMGHC